MTHHIHPSSQAQKSKQPIQVGTGEFKVRLSNKKDALSILNGMRDPDRRELGVLDPSHEYGLKSLREGIRRSEPCRTIHLNGKPVGIYGAFPHRVNGIDVGVCWLLGTNDLLYPKARKIQFIRESKERLYELHDHYPTLWNFIDSRNTLHLRWVKWMGFEIINSVELGPDRVVFHEFVRSR